MPLEKALCSNCRLEFAQDALFCPNCGTAKSRTNEDPLVGTMVGDRYQLLKQIGQGASGAIYLAEHVTLRRKLVVKVLHHELGRDDLAIERFRREATTVGELDNDHIVEIYDFGRTGDNRLYLAMEYLEGQTLANLIQEKGQLDTELVVDVLIQLGEALIEAHAMGYVHRDLRPRNMFLAIRRTHANYLKLLDFGLAKLVEQEGEAASTSLGMTFGDPHYMSPEQARGEPVDRRADIYSMGCIAYEMLSGQPPFHGGKVFDVLTRHVEEAPRSLGEVAPNTPAWLERAVMRCLSKSAEDRYITVYRFVEALRQGTDSGVIMSDEVAQSMPANPPASISRAMERLAARSSEQGEALPPLQKSSPSAAQRVDTLKVQPVVIDDVELKARTGSQTALGLGIASTAKSDLEEQVQPARTEPSEDLALGTDRKEGDSVVVAGNDAVAGGKDRKRRESAVAPKAGGSANLSAVWYADGDSLEGGDSLSDNDREKLNRARGNTPSRTGLMAVSGDELYEEFGNSNRLKYVLGGVGVIIVAIVILALSSGSSSDSTAKESGAAERALANNSGVAVPAATESAVSGTVPSAVAVPTESAALTVAVPAAVAVPAVGVEPPAVTVPSTPVVAPTSVKEPVRETRERKPRERKPRERKARERRPPPADDPFAFDTKPRRDPVAKPPGLQPLDPFASGTSDSDKEQATRLVGEGTRDLQAGDILGAASKFNKARGLNPKNGQAVAGLGEIALTQGAYAAAAGHLARASKMRPKSVRIWILLGEAYLGQSSRDKAANAFKRALKLRPDSARARNGYNEASGTRQF